MRRTHCQRVSYLFLPCLGQDVFISFTLSYTAPDEIKAADNPDASSNNFFFVCFCLLVCLFFFRSIYTTSKVENQYVLSSIPS